MGGLKASTNYAILHFYTFTKFESNAPVNTESEAVAQRCSVKKAFFKISQNSQENSCARVSFSITLQASCTPQVSEHPCVTASEALL